MKTIFPKILSSTESSSVAFRKRPIALCQQSPKAFLKEGGFEQIIGIEENEKFT